MIPEIFQRYVRDAMALNEINTPTRESYFLANIAHESSGFHRLTENLHYSAARLLSIFPKYFTPSEAVEFAYDEERIANRVYANRMGNGSETSGDGYRYRGRGLIQITGRDNYVAAGRALGIDLASMPDVAADPMHASLIAGWFWRSRGCNALADAEDFEGCVRKINGGVNGMDDRLAWLEQFAA